MILSYREQREFFQSYVTKLTGSGFRLEELGANEKDWHSKERREIAAEHGLQSLGLVTLAGFFFLCDLNKFNYEK